MLSLFKDWKGKVEVNGTVYNSISKVPDNIEFKDGWTIKLLPVVQENVVKSSGTVTDTMEHQEVRITVKKYMTQKANPEFDFMAKWNNDTPMPLRTMTGYKVKETRGMVYMKLHGDIWAKKIATCMKCGKVLTNPVSQFFGIGPECGGHNYVNPFNNDKELQEAVAEYKKKLQKITWEGWIIKSAILTETPVTENKATA